MREHFPNAEALQATYRAGAGLAKVPRPATVAPGTQGAAIDWWLRMVVDPAVPVDLPIVGLRSGRVSCLRAGHELLDLLGAFDHENHRIAPVDAARNANRPDEWWARVCYALALLVELYRAASVAGSPLMRLTKRSTAADLLGLASDVEVADLIAMKDLARVELLPHLPAGPVTTGITFDGSADLNADADLIAGGMLVDFKAGQGGTIRKDGTRPAQLARTDLHQLLGYTLMDYSDQYALRSVAVYAVRFGYLAAWPLPRLIEQMAGGRGLRLPLLRKQFKTLLNSDLPAYLAQRRGPSAP